MSLNRQDVILGRALIAWNLVDRNQLVACANELRQLAGQGRQATLGQLLVHRGLLSIDRYHAIVARLRQMYLEGSSTSIQAQNAAEQLPALSRSGHYTRTMPVPAHLNHSGVDQAVAGWHAAAGQLTASGSNLDTVQPPMATPAPPPTPAPVDEEKRPDRPIRKRLGVPPGQEQFPIAAWLVQGYVASGNFGIVYRVMRQGDPKSYALKVLKQLNPNEEVRQRFIREAKTMAKLAHPGIVRIHDAGVVKGLLWFVMDFLEGETLEDTLQDGALGVKQTLKIMRSLCSAVGYAHDRDILHRDLKPENIVLEGSKPVLTDFGLAKDNQSTLNLTAEGQRIGTPFYMAPEVLIDADVATPQTEVYALGAILYKCLTGRVPYEAKGIMALMDKIEAGKYTPLRKLCPEAPKALEKLCTRMLDKAPDKRPQTVSELATEFARLR